MTSYSVLLHHRNEPARTFGRTETAAFAVVVVEDIVRVVGEALRCFQDGAVRAQGPAVVAGQAAAAGQATACLGGGIAGGQGAFDLFFASALFDR